MTGSNSLEFKSSRSISIILHFPRIGHANNFSIYHKLCSRCDRRSPVFTLLPLRPTRKSPILTTKHGIIPLMYVHFLRISRTRSSGRLRGADPTPFRTVLQWNILSNYLLEIRDKCNQCKQDDFSPLALDIAGLSFRR